LENKWFISKTVRDSLIVSIKFEQDGILYIVIEGSLGIQNKGTLSQLLILANFCAFSPQHVDYCKCCQLTEVSTVTCLS